MKDFIADLHCHTTCSDGSKSPEEIILLAKQIGLSGLSITDHDSILAYSLASKCAQNEHIELITGVEFSTVHKTTSIHILGYAFTPNSPILQAFCEKHHVRRLTRNRDILMLLKKHGMPVSESELLKLLDPKDLQRGKTIGRPHIAEAMIKKGYVKTVQEAFKKYLGDGKCCYAAGASFSTSETIELIHEAKGLAIIAHPHLIEEPNILQELLHLNFDGIECYYAKFPMSDHERWLKIAKKKNWIVTGGSDYHGDIKPNLPLGASYVDEPLFQVLLNHFKNNL